MVPQLSERQRSPNNQLTRREFLQFLYFAVTVLGALVVKNLLKRIFPSQALADQPFSTSLDDLTNSAPESLTAQQTSEAGKELENGQGYLIAVEPLSQLDSRWADTNLGKNPKKLGYTIGSHGCLITSLSMYLRATGEAEMTPAQVNQKLKENNGYKPKSGDFDFTDGPAALGLELIDNSKYYSGPVEEEGLQFVRENIAEGRPLLARVDADLNTPFNEEHYVLIIGVGKNEKGNNLYTYADPLDGQIYTVNEHIFARKGNWFLAYNKTLESQLVEMKTLPLAAFGQTETFPEEEMITDDLGINFDENVKLNGKFPDNVTKWAPQIDYFTKKRAEKLGVSIPSELVASIIYVESGGNPNSRSKCEAIGLMQVMPRDGDKNNQCYGPISHYFVNRPTINELKGPTFNIKYGTGMLTRLMKDYNGDVRQTLKSYGPMNVGNYYTDLVLKTWKKNSPETYKDYFNQK